MPTDTALALLIPCPDDAGLVLTVMRPDDDLDLPGVWGLPAATVRPGEDDDATAARIGAAKLGAAVTLGGLLAEGSQQRAERRLTMRLYRANIGGGAPALPQRVGGDGVTRYAAWRWAPLDALAPGAARGSLCCALALDAAGSAQA